MWGYKIYEEANYDTLFSLSIFMLLRIILFSQLVKYYFWSKELIQSINLLPLIYDESKSSAYFIPKIKIAIRDDLHTSSLAIRK